MPGPNEDAMRDLYDIMMQGEIDPLVDADRFIEMSDAELRELVDAAAENDDEGIDIAEILRENSLAGRPRIR